MEMILRKSISDKLNKYCYCSNDDNDFIQVTEWVNGEGIDVTISSKGGERNFSITHGELDAIIYLKMSLDYQK